MGRQLAIVLSLFVVIAFSSSHSSAGMKDRRSLIMNGNAITTIVYNTGSISRPGIIPNKMDFVWKGLGYAYQTELLVGSKVVRSGSTSDSVAIVSEGCDSPIDGEYSPAGLKWGWLPEAGYANDNSASFAVNTDPSTWPASWAAWPGLNGEGKPIADLESYYVMNDVAKLEYPYYPFPADTTKGGLGLQVAVRHFQFDNANLGDVFFSRYEMRNVSPTPLARMTTGLFVEPHIGGSNNYSDDAANADRPHQMAYYWDPDNKSDIPTIAPGYFGIQFEETPRGPANSELGLTSFSAPLFGGDNHPKNDALMWEMMAPGRFDEADYYPVTGDNTGIFGTGYFALPSNQSAVLSIGMMCADNLASLVNLAEITADQYRIHFSPAGKGSEPLAITMTTPIAGQKVQSSTLTLTWTGVLLDNDTTIDLYYSNTYDQRWIHARGGLRNSGTYTWNLSGLPDGAFYRAYLVNRKNSQAAFDSSAGFFTIDHAGDAAPEIALVAPTKNRILSDTCTVRWAAADAEGDPVTIIVSKSEDGGATYAELASVSNTGYFNFNTRIYANTNRFRLKLEARANGKSTIVESPLCTIENIFKNISDTVISHHSGLATGKIVPIVFDEHAITQHPYRVTFDSLNGRLIYRVLDLQTNTEKIAGDTLATLYGAGKLFDGIRLWFVNDPTAPDSTTSAFVPSTVNLRSYTGVPHVGSRVYAPFDIKFTFTSFDTTSDGHWSVPGDTLSPTSGGTAVVCPFRITNATDTTKLSFVVRDMGTRGRWDWGDEIIAVTPPPYRISLTSTMMGVTFYPPANANESINVRPGDSFIARTKKSFAPGDVFEFGTQGYLIPAGVQNPDRTPVTYELAQNYPNPFNPSTTIRFSVPQNAMVRVQIFDILGREVDRVVDAPLAAGFHTVQWDASGFSSGVYFIRMTAASADGMKHFVDTRKAVYMR